jgi:formate-dependent nitrite reductase membrane component NrfD
MPKTPGWEMMIVWYFFFGGIAGGAYFTGAIADNFGGRPGQRVARAGYLISLPLVAICGALLTADLGVPLRFLNMLGAFKFSNPMSVGAWALGVFGLFAFVSSVLSFSSSPAAIWFRRNLGLVGTLFGFFLASYTGVLLSGTALPFWSEARLMGPLFLASGASTGMAAISLFLLFGGASAADGVAAIKRADRVSIVIELVMLALFLALLGSAAQPITSGHLATLFWGGLVGLGLLVPLVLDFTAHRVRALNAVAAVLVLVGGFVLRYVVLMSIQS